MMRHWAFGAVLLLLTTVPTAAGEVSGGPKLAVGDYSYRGPDWQAASDFFGYRNQMSVSACGGFFLRILTTSFFGQNALPYGLEADVLFHISSFQYGTSRDDWVRYTYAYISVPLYARFNFPFGSGVGWFMMGGPDVKLFFDTYWGKDSSGNTAESSLRAEDRKHLLFGAALSTGVYIPTGGGTLDVGLGFNTTFSRSDVDNTWKRYNNGLEIQFAFGFPF